VEIIEKGDLSEESRRESIEFNFSENLREIAGESFSTFYYNLENISSEYESGNSSVLGDIPSGLVQGYLVPLLHESEKMKSFVDRARKIVEDKFPDDLTDEDIDRAFLETYLGWKGYALYSKSLISTSGLTLELLHMREK